MFSLFSFVSRQNFVLPQIGFISFQIQLEGAEDNLTNVYFLAHKVHMFFNLR